MMYRDSCEVDHKIRSGLRLVVMISDGKMSFWSRSTCISFFHADNSQLFLSQGLSSSSCQGKTALAWNCRSVLRALIGCLLPRTTRNLGVVLDCQHHRSCRFALYNICRIRPFLTREATQLLVVISHLNYCNSLLAGLPVFAIKPLKHIQNPIARLVFNPPKFSHVTPLFCDLHWLPLVACIRFKKMVLAYIAPPPPTHTPP